MNEKLFGTDGIRAHAGEFPLNAETLIAIGQAMGETLGGTILIGQDTRMSSPWIYGLLAQGLRKTNALFENAGVIPTPGVALLVKQSHHAGGVMISASHNPHDDNGIKVFSHDGTKLNDAVEGEIERRVFALISAEARQHTDTVPEAKISSGDDTGWPEQYGRMLLPYLPAGLWLEGLEIAVDCANGAMSRIAPHMLQRLGARLRVIHATPDGRNINEGCGAVHPEALIAETKRMKADFGVAFDGDGDRAFFVSGSGRRLDGDAVLLVLARRMKRAGQLNPPIVVGTLMTNFALEKTFRNEGINLTRVAVGDRHIFDEMQRSGSALGGEPSGHVIFTDFRLSGDALLTALKVAQAIVEENATLDELTADWKPLPQLLEGVRVKERIPIEKLEGLQRKMAEVNGILEGNGRLVVRYSGTEKLLRVMIESEEAAKNERLMAELLAAARGDFAQKSIEVN